MDKSQQLFEQLNNAFDRVMAMPDPEFLAKTNEALERAIRAEHPKWPDHEVEAEAGKRLATMWPKGAVPFGSVKA